MTRLAQRLPGALTISLGAALVASCSSPEEPAGAAGSSGSAGTAAGGSAGASQGGSTAAGSGGSGAGTSGSGAAGAGVGGSGAVAGSGGTAGSAGTGVAGGPGGAGSGGGYTLDCGPNAQVIESAGPPENRVNYVIIGDGYSAAELETTYLEHIEFAMTKRFSDPIGQVYLRYRKFVNICAVKLASPGAICGDSALGCCGNDSSRLANCNSGAANDAISENVPQGFEVDWRAVVLNGDSWWNTGATLMLWSGGNRDAHGAALHEGGHGFHQLADEYGNCGSNWVNNTDNNTDSGGKWDLWLDFDQQPGTAQQGFFSCGGNAWRPSDNSMMNSLFGDDPDTSFNAVSREKMVMDMWRAVTPIDSTEPPAGAVTAPAALTVNVIDPVVVSVEWTVDGAVSTTTGPSFSTAGLTSGTHMISARAYDNAGMDLVRYRSHTEFGRQNWARSEQTVSWTVTIP